MSWRTREKKGTKGPETTHCNSRCLLPGPLTQDDAFALLANKADPMPVPFPSTAKGSCEALQVIPWAKSYNSLMHQMMFLLFLKRHQTKPTKIWGHSRRNRAPDTSQVRDNSAFPPCLWWFPCQPSQFNLPHKHRKYLQCILASSSLLQSLPQVIPQQLPCSNTHWNSQMFMLNIN